MADSKPITRITMFKVPSAEGQQILIEGYKKLLEDSKKDGKRYILSQKVGPALITTEDDAARAQGWTVVAQTTFANAADVRYYDQVDEAHAVLRETARASEIIAGGPAGVLTVCFEGQ